MKLLFLLDFERSDEPINELDLLLLDMWLLVSKDTFY